MTNTRETGRTETKPTWGQLTQAVQYLTGVGPQRAELLAKLGIRTAADLMFYFPRRYEDFTQQSTIAELDLDQVASVIGVVEDIDQQKKDGRHVLYVLLKQNGGYLRGIWFNQEYLLNKFQFGQTVQFRGKVGERGGRLQMVHPEVTWIEHPESTPTESWQPVYGLTDGIKQNRMRLIVGSAVEKFTDLVPESIPEELRQLHGLCPIHTAIRQIHAPRNQQEQESARRRLVFQELLILQLALSMRRWQVRQRGHAPRIELTPKIRARMLGRLPFELRGSQLAVLEEIAADMALSFPMNRLLHGEVGSGKTVVAACAMMLTAAYSHQAVLMTPTELLAHQHFQVLQKLLAGSRVRIERVTGSQTAKQRQAVAAAIADGEVDLVVGTTAVTDSSLQFKSLGLVVIDEQHKFGVRQRALLKQAGLDPHYLVMTATPIPRTITMTLFGDLDVSTLQRDDTDRQVVHTYLGDVSHREKWWEFVRKKLRQGRQGFVIAPLVEGSPDSQVQSAEQMFESLCNGPLEEFRLAILHGRQSSDEKQNVMDEFVRGNRQVLVATGIVEVGIDVPNATLMTIESAERFGLSQLHQLRGRVGRGRHPGFVCIFPSDNVSAEIQRLQAFAEINNGFELAQLDLQFRGPGNLLSTRQTGFPPLRIADLVQDEQTLLEVRTIARSIIDDDPELTAPQHQRLRRLVLSRYSTMLELSDVG